MSHTCTPILVGGAFPVLEILLPSKTANFPFLTMNYSPWSSKNLIDRNWLKKYMQVEIDVTYMYTNFSGRCLSSFGDTATFKNGQISLSNHGPFPTMDYSPWSSKNLLDWNWLKKFKQVEIDVTYMYNNFGGRDFFCFGDIGTFKNGQFSLSSPWSSKNLLDWNWLKKFKQVEIDVTYMYNNFGGRDFFCFGDIGTFKNGQFSLSSPWSSKNLLDWNWLKIFMQIEIDVTYMFNNFGGWCLSGFGDTATFKKGQISLSDHGL